MANPDFRQYSGIDQLHGLAGELTTEERQERREMLAVEERAKLWELYKIALPLEAERMMRSSEENSTEEKPWVWQEICAEALSVAKVFLAHWKAEPEASDLKIRREMADDGLRGGDPCRQPGAEDRP